MAVRINFLLMGCIFLFIFSFYIWDISKEKAAERFNQLREGRKQLLRETCDADKEAFNGGKHSLEDLTYPELENLIVDDEHGVIYCYLPKVGCTNWKRVFSVLGQGKPYKDPMSILGPMAHVDKHLTFLKSFPRQEMMAKLKYYTKFLIVRNPFIRLISAFRHKLQMKNEGFYQKVGRSILRLYGNYSNPPMTMDEAIAKGVLPSFHNFIQYLLDPRTEENHPFDEHWRQMHRMCHPCLIQYDFVGHQETLKEDADHLLKLLGLEDDIKFPPVYENVTSAGSLLDWFSTVPLEDRRKLYEIYEKDFKLFGYRKPDELLDAAERFNQLREGRKQLLRETCDADKEAFNGGKHSLEDLTYPELENLIVDDEHGVIYCYLPKVGCTNWKRVFSVLGQGKPYKDPMSILGPMAHVDKHLTFLKSFPRQEMMAKLKYYTKFLIVRNPFIRLISAFRHKLQMKNEGFYQKVGRSILRLYGNYSNPPMTMDEAIAKGVLPSFHNFIQYLLDPRTEENHPFDEHWRQMHRMCHPCLIQYDFVGHQETLKEDADHLLKLLGLEDDIKFPPVYENVTSAGSLLDWFSTVPLEDRRKLYEIYEKDFKLFGYRKPDELLDG